MEIEFSLEEDTVLFGRRLTLLPMIKKCKMLYTDRCMKAHKIVRLVFEFKHEPYYFICKTNLKKLDNI